MTATEIDSAPGEPIGDSRVVSGRPIALPPDPSDITPLDQLILAGGRGTKELLQKAIEVTPLSDLGNGARLARDFGNDIRYAADEDRWYVWDGARFSGEMGHVRLERLAKAATRAIYLDAAKEPDDAMARQMAAWALKSQSLSRLRAMIEVARSERGIAVGTDDFDRDADLLNCPNGTVDLRTGSLRAHRREDLITKLAGVDFDPVATCPTWDRFVSRAMLGDQLMVDYLRRLVGYMATGQTIEHVFPIFFGGGANGKSTFVNTVSMALGQYARATHPSTLMERANDRGGLEPEVIKLIGARFVSAVESNDGKRLDEGRIKAITGGDRLSARTLHSEPIEFSPTFKMLLATNHRPTIRGTDQGIWRRVHLVEWHWQIPADEQNTRFGDELAQELPGILAWIVRGAVDWYAGGLAAPPKVLAATAAYRSAMDALATFLDEACVVAPHVRVGARDLLSAYRQWAERNGERDLTQRALGLALSDRGFGQERTASARYWRGIGLLGGSGPDSSFSPREA